MNKCCQCSIFTSTAQNNMRAISLYKENITFQDTGFMNTYIFLYHEFTDYTKPNPYKGHRYY